MMEQSKATSAAKKGPIPAPVSTDYCVADETLFITDQRDSFWGFGLEIAVRDSEGRVVFRSKKEKIFSGESEEPLLYFKEKWRRWEVYRGEDDVLFKMGKTSISPYRESFDIFLAGNDSHKADFKMKQKFSCSTYKFGIQHGSTPVAEVESKSPRHWHIKAYAGMDSAFLACLVVMTEKNLVESRGIIFDPIIWFFTNTVKAIKQ